MKTKILIALMFISVAFVACQNDDDLDNGSKQLKVSEKFMQLKQGFAASRNILGKRGNSQFSATSTLNLKSAGVKSDEGDSTCVWAETFETCANVSESTDSDGNKVVVMDYGVDGCNDYGMLTKGKIITTYYKTDASSEREKMKEEYVDFSYSYSMCWDDEELDECNENEEETVTMNGVMMIEYSYNAEGTEGSYSFTEDLVMSYSDDEEVSSKSTYKEVMTEDSYTVLEGEGLYKGKDYEYSFKVMEPVVTKFSCGENSFMPVSGIEKDSYKGKTEEGKDESFTYEIDYGNGECDNKATVTENGVSEKVNFDDIYYEGEGESFED